MKATAESSMIVIATLNINARNKVSSISLSLYRYYLRAITVIHGLSVW